MSSGYMDRDGKRITKRQASIEVKRIAEHEATMAIVNSRSAARSEALAQRARFDATITCMWRPSHSEHERATWEGATRGAYFRLRELESLIDRWELHL